MSRLGRVLCWGITLLVGFALAGSWVLSGGFFAPGHDAYGTRARILRQKPQRDDPRSNTHAAVTTVGHESWNTVATFDVPATGAYRVAVLDPGDNGDSRHGITIGKGPWAPVPPWLFGLGILAVAVAIGFIADEIRKRINDRTAR